MRVFLPLAVFSTILQLINANAFHLSSDTDLDIFIHQNLDVLANNAIYLNYFDYGNNQ